MLLLKNDLKFDNVFFCIILKNCAKRLFFDLLFFESCRIFLNKYLKLTLKNSSYNVDYDANNAH